MLGKFTLTLKNHLPSGEILVLRICPDEMPPFEQFTYNLKWKQIQALWLIAEGDVLPQMGGRGQAGWHLAKKLKLADSQLTRDIISPLKKRHLIYNKKRLVENKGKRHPAWENEYHLERTNIRNVFFILLDVFLKRHLNKIIGWEGASPINLETVTRENWIAQIRMDTLAYLQRKLDDYENSTQYFEDRGIKPPSSYKFKPTAPEDPPFVLKSVGALRYGPISPSEA